MKYLSLLSLIILFSACEKPDTVAPIMEVRGSEVTFHRINTDFVDEGAVAFDDCNGNISDNVMTRGTVDISNYGQNVLTYYVEDEAKNITNIERLVNVLPYSNDLAGSYNVNEVCDDGNEYFYQADIIAGTDITKFGIRNLGGWGESVIIWTDMDGPYLNEVVLDTNRYGLDFLGTGIFSTDIQSMQLDYSVSDTAGTLNCVATFVRR